MPVRSDSFSEVMSQNNTRPYVGLLWLKLASILLQNKRIFLIKCSNIVNIIFYFFTRDA